MSEPWFRLLEDLSNDPRAFCASFYQTSDGLYSRYLDNADLCSLADGRLQPDSKTGDIVGNIVSDLSPDHIGVTRVNPDISQYKINIEGVDYSLTAYFLRDLDLTYRENPGPAIGKLASIVKDSCLYRPDYILGSYIGGDIFTNNLLISIIIAYVFNVSDMQTKNYVQTYGASLCHREGQSVFDTKSYGLILTEAPDLGSLERIGIDPRFSQYRSLQQFSENRVVRVEDQSPYDRIYLNMSDVAEPDRSTFLIEVLSAEFVQSVFLQLLATLDFLHQSVDFRHGGPLVSKIMLSNEACNFSYKDVEINSPITAKISDYRRSSLTLVLNERAHHFYNRNWLSDIYLDSVPFIPAIIDGSYYILDDNFTIYLYNNLLDIGYPFYASFDIYILSVSMLMLPQIFYSVLTDDILREGWWDILWYEDDRLKAQTRIQSIIQADAVASRSSLNNLTQIINVLKGLKLKCSLSLELLNAFKA